jgi:hypothetical protein
MPTDWGLPQNKCRPVQFLNAEMVLKAAFRFLSVSATFPPNKNDWEMFQAVIYWSV